MQELFAVEDNKKSLCRYCETCKDTWYAKLQCMLTLYANAFNG